MSIVLDRDVTDFFLRLGLEWKKNRSHGKVGYILAERVDRDQLQFRMNFGKVKKRLLLLGWVYMYEIEPGKFAFKLVEGENRYGEEEWL